MVRARVLNTDAKNGNDPVVPGVNVNGKWFPEIVISHRFSKIKNIAVELAPVVPRKHEVKLNGAKAELRTKHLPPLRMLQNYFLPDGTFRPFRRYVRFDPMRYGTGVGYRF